jgi:hypothetical protein
LLKQRLAKVKKTASNERTNDDNYHEQSIKADFGKKKPASDCKLTE